MLFKNTVLLVALVAFSCKNTNDTSTAINVIEKQDKPSIIVAANRTEAYLPLLKGKRIALVANQTSVIFKKQDTFTHLVDSLLSLNISIKKVLAPEHGFRGTADAGEDVKDDIDTKTGLPIASLHGKSKKPSAAQLKDIDLVVFDIQDVGARFYTYISSLHYVMEACAEQNIPLLVLDRPNPNGHYIDGPILEMKHQSFIGMHPIPTVHGMTIGEYAQMINGETWLKNGVTCDLKVIPVENYTHKTPYNLPIKPSPNLPNDVAINLYPSICFFEGTTVSVGRGTEMQFQVIGAPYLSVHSFAFTPKPNLGSKYPKHKNKLCTGIDLRNANRLNEINLDWLIQFYKTSKLSSKEPFFIPFFTNLAGTKTLQQQIESGKTEAEIKESWAPGLNAFKKTRSKYLIYND